MLKGILRRVGELLTRTRRVDEELLEELEQALIEADVPPQLALKLVGYCRAEGRRRRIEHADGLRALLAERVAEILGGPRDDLALARPEQPPAVYLIVGVNGTGKTTTIGKLAWRFRQQGHKVLLAAADTFRAAAIDQLEIWARRAGADVVRHKEGADPGAVTFDAIEAAKARGVDYVIVDTAGRLHTKRNLMQELEKIGRVCQRALGRPADEILLVIDATMGQNALRQAEVFKNVVGLSGVVLTKMDGTARGGVILGIRESFGIPVKLLGTGEKLEDLEDFDPERFARALFE